MPLLLQVDHVFVWVGNVQILPHLFTRQVGIDMVRIKQFHPVAQNGPLFFQRRDLLFAPLQQGGLFAPRKQAERADQRHGPKAKQPGE